MYIEKIKIDKFRVLEDIEIHFQPPCGATADPETGNVVNIIAGVNGTGKTSLLEAIFQAVSNPHAFCYTSKYGSLSVSNFSNVSFENWQPLYDKINRLNKENQGKHSFYGDPRLVFLPSQQSFQYSPVTQMTVQYSF